MTDAHVVAAIAILIVTIILLVVKVERMDDELNDLRHSVEVCSRKVDTYVDAPKRWL